MACIVVASLVDSADPQIGQLSASTTAIVITVVGGLIVALIAFLADGARKLAMAKLRSWFTVLTRRRAVPSWDLPDVETIKKQSRVLIVDDGSYAHFEQLPLRGFAVTHEKRIDREKETVVDENFDLLILDVKGVQDAFGAKDGIDALELLRRDNPWVPIMIHTAYLGDLSDSRKNLVREHTQKAIPKIIPFHEFEELVMELLQLGRTPAYLEAVLKGLEVADPGRVLKMVEESDELPNWEFEKDVNPSPFQKAQVVAVLRRARSIFTGARWRRKA